jgi:single-strand DNA-binding protein
MAGSYNKIILVGNLTREPEIRYVDGGGKAVTKFGMAINHRTKSGNEPMFMDIIAWDKLGETCNTYLKKGMSVLVEGRLVVRNYETKEGEKRKAVEVVAVNMQMLDSKSRTNGEHAAGGAALPAASSHSTSLVDDFDGEEVPF